jgi:GDPmannose 4,6-dehydratase
MPTALVIGASGQDGAYLSRLLLEKGYVVHGTSRDAESSPLRGLKALGIDGRVVMHSMSPHDLRSVLQTLERVAPTEVYNLSGQTSVALSFTQPAETMESIVSGTLNILEALRVVGGDIRFYNAGSSECFGDTGRHPANELTAFRPRSPYGVAKAAAVSLVTNYRESYGLYACSGLLFNHESPLRQPRFVTGKIVAAAARIGAGLEQRLALGDLSIHRDWGYAPDYVRMMWSMLQQPRADDYVVATGIAHSLESFVDIAFRAVGLEWRAHVDHEPTLKRPSDIAFSVGDASKAARAIGWRPSIDFEGLVALMVEAERGKLAAAR